VTTKASDRANLFARLEEIGLFFLIPILDHVSKLVLGWAPEERAITALALEGTGGGPTHAGGLFAGARGPHHPP
jgi:hypothetical protein